MKKINLKSKFKKFSDQWAPKVVEEMNDYQFKLVKIENDFTWHKHKDTDETFLVIEGKMGIEFEDETVELNEGEMLVVPKGKKHKPSFHRVFGQIWEDKTLWNNALSLYLRETEENLQKT